MKSWVSSTQRWWSTEEDPMRQLNGAVYMMKESGLRTVLMDTTGDWEGLRLAWSDYIDALTEEDLEDRYDYYQLEQAQSSSRDAKPRRKSMKKETGLLLSNGAEMSRIQRHDHFWWLMAVTIIDYCTERQAEFLGNDINNYISFKL